VARPPPQTQASGPRSFEAGREGIGGLYWGVFGLLLGGLGAWLGSGGTAFLAFFACGASPRGKLVLLDQGGVEISGDGVLDCMGVVALVVLEPQEFHKSIEGFFADGDAYEAEAVAAALAQASGSGG
jgi:hypothetical protein